MKRSSKKLIALLAAFSLATATAALVGCKDDNTPKADAGIYEIYQLYANANANPLTYEQWLEALKTEAKGENGKSAYEIAKENGFEGTEKEWLESLKGEAAHEHTYDENVKPTLVVAPTLYKDGLAFKTCADEECGHIEVVTVGKTVAEIGKPVTVTNDMDGFWLEIPEVNKEGEFTFKAESGDANITDDVTIKCYASYDGGIPVSMGSGRWFTEGMKVFMHFTVDRMALETANDEITITPYVISETDTFDHVITVKANDGTAGGATKVQAYNGTEMVAEGDVVDGKATLNMIPGVYTLKLVDLDETKYEMVATSTKDSLMGSNCAIQLLMKYTYTFTVKNGDTPVSGATVTLHEVQAWNQAHTEAVDYKAAAYKTATTSADGVATIEVTEKIYTPSGVEVIGVYCQAKFTADLAVDEQPCGPVVLSTENTSVTLTVVDKPVETWDVDKTVTVAANTTFVAGKTNVSAEDAGEYTLTIWKDNLETVLAPSNYAVTVTLGEQVVTLNQANGWVATLTLSEGDNIIVVAGINGNKIFKGMTVLVEKAVAGGEGGEEVPEVTVEDITLDANNCVKLTSGKEYKLALSKTSNWKVELIFEAQVNGVMYKSKADADADGVATNYYAPWFDLYGASDPYAEPDSPWYVEPFFVVKGVNELTFYVHSFEEDVEFNPVAIEVTLKITEDDSVVDLGTVLTLNTSVTAKKGKYSFTATEDGTYYLLTKFNMSTYATVFAETETWTTGDPVFFDNQQATYKEISLKAGETISFYVVSTGIMNPPFKISTQTTW